MAKVLSINDIDQRILEREKLIKANNNLLLKMEMAMKKKLIETNNQQYGFGNEEKLMPEIQRKCQDSLEQKKKEEEKGKMNLTLIGNFLMNKIHEQKTIQDLQLRVHRALKQQFMAQN